MTSPAPDLLALESQVCFALAVASRRVIGLYRPVLEPLGLTHPQYLVMLALWQYEPLTVRRLGELVSLEPATLSPLLNGWRRSATCAHPGRGGRAQPQDHPDRVRSRPP